MTAADLFTRHGQPHAGAIARTERGRPYFIRQRTCGRCGGAGGADQWAHTGWKCYDCGGKGTNGIERVKLYTAAEIERLDATAAKRRAKVQAKRNEIAAERALEADRRRADFLTVHGELLAAAEALAHRSEFLADVARRARAVAALSDSQIVAITTAIDKIRTSDARKAASVHVGAIGERVTLEVTVERVFEHVRPCFNAHWQTEILFIVTMRTAAGAAIVSKSTRFAPEQGKRLTIAATVKEHSTYRDERQTVVQRIKQKEIA